MKRTDDPRAKLKFWVEHPRVVALPRIANLPRFGSRRFASHAEMNQWKRDLLRQLAAQGGCQWTS